LNYVEGQATIGTQVLNANSIGSVELQPGETLATQNGKAEILLTPGVFLRLAQNSAVQINSAGLADTEVTVEKGRAMVEVGEIHSENNIVIRQDGQSAKLTKKGLYEFNADANEIHVFDGKADVQTNGQTVELKGGHELTANTDKPRSFNKKESEDDLYRWASLRSSYLAEANMDAAGGYVNGGLGWYGTGWYWDPAFASYTWIPGDGVFWSPFGWGFYSPWQAYYAFPFYGYGYGGYYHHFGPGYRPHAVAHGFVGGSGFRGGAGSAGFSRGRGGFSGGGHAGGGGGHR
jgi:hypothetical protein